MGVVTALVDAGQGELEVLGGEDHGAADADVLAARDDLRMVDVVEVVAGHPVVLHDEPGPALGEQVADPLGLVLGFAEAGELEDPPRFRAVAARVGAAQVGGLPRHRLAGRGGHVPRPVRDLQRNAGDGRVLVVSLTRICRPAGLPRTHLRLLPLTCSTAFTRFP